MLRSMNLPTARLGIMLAAVPPSRTMPWTRASVRSCCRHSPIDWKRSTRASSALRPIHGSEAACAWRPVKVTSTSTLASRAIEEEVRSFGWNSSAASTPPNSPSSSMYCLPDPRSSAGQPRNTISPGNSAATEARAIAAPTPDAAIVLCPHPCPSPGRASYSARMPIRGPSPPRPPRNLPRTAVSSRPAGCSTAYP